MKIKNYISKIMGKSRLLFDPYVEYVDLMELGNKYVSSNSFTETPLITGRFIHSVESGVYDGLINMGSFNCQPAMNSQTIIRPLANKYDISTNQRRLLDAIAIQSRRNYMKKIKEGFC